MRPEGCEPGLLRALASMPFLDRLEMVAITGWSRGAVYEAVASLESGGLCASVLHALDPMPPARRFHLTGAGLHRLADEEGRPIDEVVRGFPLSAQWRRILMERLDGIAAIYHLAAAVSNVEYPIAFRWYRAMPMDAAMTLPGGKTVGIVRQGSTTDRSGFAKRIWRLREVPLPGTVLVLMADEVRLRHARRLLSTTDVPALFALERQVVLAGTGDEIWRPPKTAARISLRYELERLSPGGEIAREPEPGRADVPADLPGRGAASDMADYLLPVMLSSAEKRALDLVSDWPWISLRELAGLMGVTPQRVSQLVNPLEGFRLVARPGRGGRTFDPHRPGHHAPGPQGPRVGGSGEEALEHRPGGPRRPLRVAKPLRQEDPPASQEHRAHRRRPRLPGRARRAGLPAGVGGRPARSSQEGVETLQARRADARRQPRRLRRPRNGREDLALLPGVGAPRRAAIDHVGASRPVSALLLISQANRRPRRAARRTDRLRRRDRTDPLPARGCGRRSTGRGSTSPCGCPTGRP